MISLYLVWGYACGRQGEHTNYALSKLEQWKENLRKVLQCELLMHGAVDKVQTEESVGDAFKSGIAIR